LQKIKILKEYQIPVGDPVGTFDIKGLKNQVSVELYSTSKTEGGMMARPVLNNNVFWCHSVIIPQ